MKTTIRRFQEMARLLDEHPNVQLHSFHFFPPLAADQLQQLEDQTGLRMPAAVREFYSQTNGLQLHWSFGNAWPKTSTDNPVLQWENLPEADGLIFFPPIEEVLTKDWAEQIYFDWMEEESPLRVHSSTYPLLDFSKRIRPFDCFGQEHDMAFFIDRQGYWQVVMGEDQHHFYNHSRLTDFESYLEFLLASKGHVASRIHFYRDEQGLRRPRLKTPAAYWNEQNSLSLDQAILETNFQMATQLGRSTSDIQQPLLQQRARQQQVVGPKEWQIILDNHQLFLQSGGAGGSWKPLLVNGLVIGLYEGAEVKAGMQAQLEYRRLPDEAGFRETDLPYANLCGLHAQGVDFSTSNLSHCLFTDALLESAKFEHACLRQTDFSRARLQAANFRYADLRGADFENSDLRQADFRFANLDGARFPGARLEGVLR
ncbi:MAG: pentapeptide repeat-containing protein [Bacteroidota bacterium]